ncbi:MAG: ArgE/DapE family deacylase [Chloroflexi bacterium]|nr:ArgE/DapE family deacylase [Chloroflexota bacterium]
MTESQIRERVLAEVDALADDLVQMTIDTVRIPSVNPTYPGIDQEAARGGETRVNEFCQPLMEAAGLETDLWEAEEGRANLAGTLRGAGGGRSLLFNGHVDVVPPGPDANWSKTGPWSGEVIDGKIWGRGSCDMKGGNAATLTALRAVLNAGLRPKGDVILEFVVGEEMMNTEAGTGAAIERGYTADAAIVAEASGPPYRLGIIPASPGLLYMALTVKGRAVHASMRDELIRAGGGGAAIGVSSIDKAQLIMDGLRQLEEEWGQTKSHPMFKRPGHFTIYPGFVQGGPNGPFVISEESRVEYAIWHPPQEPVDDVRAEIETHIARVAATDSWLRDNPPKVEWLLWWPPFDVSPDEPICKALEAAYTGVFGTEAPYYGFAAVDDGAFLNRAGIPAITIGPGSLLVAHGPDEHVEIDELIDAAKIYALAIVEWCGVAS